MKSSSQMTRSLPDSFIEASSSGASLTMVGGDGERAFRTYSDLLETASSQGASLVERGIEPGDRVGIVAHTSFDFVAGCLSAWFAGTVVVPVPSPWRLVSLEGWAGQARARLTTSKARAFIASQDDPVFDPGVEVVPINTLGEKKALSVPLAQHQDAAIVQFSSGTTGSARGVVISHRALLAQFEGLQGWTALDNTLEDHTLTWLPMYHDLGLVPYLLRPLALGVPATLMPTAVFLSDPGRWLVEISRCRATYSPAPNFAYALAARALERGMEPVDLSSWRHAASGGEGVDQTTLRRFVDVASKHGFDEAALAPGYGLAEATCVVSVTPTGTGVHSEIVDREKLAEGWAGLAGDSTRRRAELVSVGVPLPGTVIRIRDESGRDLAPRRIGEIHVRGPCLMEGYLDDPEGTARAIEDGWLRTGDLGYMAEGRLYVTGRKKDTIIIRGQNYFPEDIERIVQQVEGVRPGGAAVVGVEEGSTEGMVVVAEVLTDGSDQEACRKSISQKVWSEAGVPLSRVVLVPARSLPKTTSGKLQRSKVRELIKGSSGPAPDAGESG